jgi:hypothetical protein
VLESALFLQWFCSRHIIKRWRNQEPTSFRFKCHFFRLREEESEQERKKTRPYYSGICLTLGTHGAWPHAEGLIDGFYCNLRKFGMDSILHMQDGTLCVYIKLVSYM